MIRIGIRYTGNRTERRVGGAYECQRPNVDPFIQGLILAKPRQPNWLGKLIARIKEFR